MNKMIKFKEDKYVLATGATSGIGYAIAEVFAKNGFNMFLVARNESKLSKIAEEFNKKYKVSCKFFPCDLSVIEEINRLYAYLVKNRLEVFILINNAGFGYWGYFHQFDPIRQIQMINLNVTGLTHLTRLLVADMIKMGFGKILNVSSFAGLQPMGLLSTYAATKTYVLYFSQGLDMELEEKNISVSVLCPPNVKTNFQKVAGNPDYESPGFMCMSAEDVANITYRQFLKNKKIIKPWKPALKIMMLISSLLPAKIVGKSRMQINRKTLLKE